MTCLKNSLNASGLLIALNTIAPPSWPGEVLHSYVGHVDGRYLLQLEMRIDAPRDRVYAVLLDFDALFELNDTIVDSQLLSFSHREYRVLLVTEGCLWFFCRQVTQVQTVTELGRGYLQSVTDPEVSDLVSGKVLWYVRPDPRRANQALITYSADFEPDFWIPPLIGPWLMKGRLLQEGQETINGIEEKAGYDSD